jgi:hypothetical protein
MYLLDQADSRFRGKELTNFRELVPDSKLTYLEGCKDLLEDYLKDKLKR